MIGLSPKYTQKTIILLASKIFKDQKTIYYSGFSLLSWRRAVLTLQLSCHSGSDSNEIMELSWLCSRSKNHIHYPIPAEKQLTSISPILTSPNISMYPYIIGNLIMSFYNFLILNTYNIILLSDVQEQNQTYVQQ